MTIRPTINLKIKIDSYTNNVLKAVMKKEMTKTKGDAICWFVHEYGGDIIEEKMKPEYAKELLLISKETMKKYESGERKPITRKDLKKLFEID